MKHATVGRAETTKWYRTGLGSAAIFGACVLTAFAQPQKQPVDYVSPNIGGIGHLLTATVPRVRISVSIDHRRVPAVRREAPLSAVGGIPRTRRSACESPKARGAHLPNGSHQQDGPGRKAVDFVRQIAVRDSRCGDWIQSRHAVRAQHSRRRTSCVLTVPGTWEKDRRIHGESLSTDRAMTPGEKGPVADLAGLYLLEDFITCSGK